MIALRMTQAPLPSWLNLLRALFIPNPPEESLSSTWTQKGDISYWFSRSAWSIRIIARLRQRVTGCLPLTVWVPDFFCNESLSLLRLMGTKLVFYPINEQYQPDKNHFPTITADNKPDLFLLVHYFGEPTPFAEAIEFCKYHSTWLIEDAAHVLRPITGVGETGDFVLYSPHKHLAIPDGAVLIIRQNGPSSLGYSKKIINILDEVRIELHNIKTVWSMKTVYWLGKRILQKLGFRYWKTRQGFFQKLDTPSMITDSPTMSTFGKRLLKFELDQLTRIAAHRFQLATEWEKVLTNTFPKGGFKVLCNAQPPYLAQIDFDDQSIATSTYLQLQKIGVPVCTWPDLPPEVITSEKADSFAILFRNTRIYLPVHQSMRIHQICSIGDKLRNLNGKQWQLRQIESQSDWEKFWLSCKRKSLPQTWEYGSAKASAEGWEVHRYIVHDEKNVPTALFQVLVKGLPWLGGVARVNRGPLIFQAAAKKDSQIAYHAIAAIIREARRKRWWMIQIAPLLPPGNVVEEELRKLRLRKQLNYPADSALLSLEDTEEKLLMRLNGKWRNCLRKGQKLGVKIQHDEGGVRYLPWLLDFYKTQQREKRFEGTSDKMLSALSKNQSHWYKFNLFIAFEGQEIAKASLLGVLVTIQFGDVSEYLIAVTNDKGRLHQANSVLLWEAILNAKRKGCQWFDVGGLSENTPKGIADFKMGLNPQPYSLVGEWRRWF